MSRMSTVKMHPVDLPRLTTVRAHEPAMAVNGNGEHQRRMSDVTTVRLSSRIELPRLTEALASPDDSHRQSASIPSPDTSVSEVSIRGCFFLSLFVGMRAVRLVVLD